MLQESFFHRNLLNIINTVFESIVVPDSTGVQLNQVLCLKYLGSISENGGFREDVRARMKAACRDMYQSGIVCDRRMAANFKIKVL